MKNRLWILLCFGVLLVVGCNKYGEKDILKDLSKKIESATAYNIKGELEILNNEDSFLYDVVVGYEKDDKFRVSLKNRTNNHEQIILKNEDGVYVLTPSLNKSFKFQSEWPYNNSQIYLLQTVLTDIKNDSDRVMVEDENGYMFTTKVDYDNNKNLVKQNVYMDKDLTIKEIHVLNGDDVVQMKMKFNSIDYKAKYDDNYFTLKNDITTSTSVEIIEPVSSIDSITYPMYVPTNTYLTGQDKVSKTDGERVILTFTGDKPFMLIQETAEVEEVMLTIPTYGEPELIVDTVGSISDTSVNWISNGIEYYVVSDILTEQELLSIAKSISVMPVGK